MTVRLYEIPFSTNVERVALALAHKGLTAEHVTLDPSDRSPVRELTGQDLVPVLVHDGDVVFDSPRILEYLEERYPEAPLLPAEPARRAEARVFVDWFNRVWKVPPNAIEAELGAEQPDEARIAALSDEMARSLDLFEALLDGRDHLLGPFSVADCVAFPFLKYGRGLPPGDDELFHRVLADHLPLGPRHPRLRAWIERVDARPRA